MIIKTGIFNSKYTCFVWLLFIVQIPVQAQLGFCQGSSGDPIFIEDFGQGTTNGPPLSSDVTSYQYVNQAPQDGQYTISSNLQQLNSFHNISDRTGNLDGKALIVNASFDPGLFYQIPIEGLCINNSYEFSAFLINIYDRDADVCPGGGIPVNVRFQIWDETDTQLLAEGDTGDIFGTNNPMWQQFALTFTTLPGQTSVILKMLNNGQGGCGNDLAIDDIVFKSCGDFTEIVSETGETSIQICEGDTLTDFTLESNPDFSVYASHSYQWQESDDGENWNNIPEETNQQIVIPEISEDKFYRTLVAEDPANVENTSCNSISTVFEFDRIEFIDPVSLGDVMVCEGDSNSLAVEFNNNISVNWYDSPENGTPLAENTFKFQPQQLGVYYAEAVTIEGNCINPERVEINYSEYETPVLNDETLRTCLGETITLSETIEDAEYLWSTGETTNSIEVSTAGNYTLEVTTTNGCIVTKTFTVENIDNIDPVSLGDVMVCEGNSAPIGVEENNEISINWYDSPENGNLLAEDTFEYQPEEFGVYYAEAINNDGNCTNPERVRIEYSPYPTPELNDEIVRSCIGESLTLSENINNATYLWSTGETSNSIEVNNEGDYTVQITTENDCIISKTFTVSYIEYIDPVSRGDVFVCENEIQNLAVEFNSDISVDWYDSPENGTLLAEDTFQYQPESSGTYYAEATTIQGNCINPNRVEILYSKYPIPEINDENIQACEGESVILTETINNVDYLWSTGETTRSIEIQNAGEYTLELTTVNNCVVSKTFTVETFAQPVIDTIIQDNESLIIETSTEGAYSYSIDGSRYQNRPVFENLEGGLYTVYVRENNGCGIVTEEFLYFDIPNFFTPNGDMINDTFKINGDTYFDTFEIAIFDRYGKILASSYRAPFEWNGTYNGKKMPSDDYWYKIKVDGKIYTGHFTLKR